MHVLTIDVCLRINCSVSGAFLLLIHTLSPWVCPCVCVCVCVCPCVCVCLCEHACVRVPANQQNIPY